jgi:hypothetical protein
LSYDDVAVRVIAALCYQAMNFSVLGDATFNREQAQQALLSAKSGAIIICHMNHPESETAERAMTAVPELRRQGIRFVRLEECLLK